jgi:hypothetical protein
MTNRDYTKEVGIPSHKKTVSRPGAYVVLGVVAVGISFGIAEVVSQTKQHSEAEKPASASTTAAPAPVTESVPTK